MQFSGELTPIERYFLMLLFAPDASGKFAQPLRGNTWYQKMMFMLSRLVKGLDEDTEFDAYAMGSYSETVEELEDQFAISGLSENTDGGIKLSLEGKAFAEKVWGIATNDERSIVTGVKSWLNDLNFYELLAVAYTLYPETAVNSHVRDAVEIRRPEIAISLLKKRKATIELASRIAGMSQSVFERYLGKKGVSLAEIETADVLVDRALLDEIEKSEQDSARRRLVTWETVKGKA